MYRHKCLQSPEQELLCFPDFFLRHGNLDICGGICWIKSPQISFHRSTENIKKEHKQDLQVWSTSDGDARDMQCLFNGHVNDYMDGSVSTTQNTVQSQ